LDNGVQVVGDCDVAKHLARRVDMFSEKDLPLLESCMDYALKLSKSLAYEMKVKAIFATLNHTLESRHLLSMADISLLYALGYPTQQSDRGDRMNSGVIVSVPRLICQVILEH
jgi:hypothetical protein